MNYEIYKCYSDRGISGKSIKGRPAMQELLKDAQEEKFNIVITKKKKKIKRDMLNL